MADIALIIPRFEISYCGLEYAMPALGRCCAMSLPGGKEHGYPLMFATDASIDLAEDAELMQLMVDANICRLSRERR
jgi:hypothetical protein